MTEINDTSNIIRFNPTPGKYSSDIDLAKEFFKEFFDFQAGVVNATARSLNDDDADDLLVFIEGLGPVSAGTPETLPAIKFYEDLIMNVSEIMSMTIQKTTQIIENTSKAAGGGA